MWEWYQDHRFWIWTVSTGVSVVLFVGSLVVIPIILARIPADYFVRERAPRRPSRSGAALRHAILLVLKNLLALTLVAAGIVMLVTPGQGILSIAAGALLLDYPGKRNVEIWLVRRRAIRRTIDRIRHRHGRPPLLLPDDAKDGGTKR